MDGGLSPPTKREGRSARAAVLQTQRLARCYRAFRFPQRKKRKCGFCGGTVSNKTLGGFTGRSALSGNLFCYGCADSAPPIFIAIARLDYPQQLVLNFGGV